MNRRLSAIIGLVLGVVVVTSAFGQSSQPRKSLTQRMADMRRSWSQNDESAPSEQFENPQAEGGSLIPSWLGGGNEKKPNASMQQRQNQGGPRPMNGQQLSPRTGQPGMKQPATPTTQSRFAAGQKGTTGQSAPAVQSPTTKRATTADGFTLPGLGGSPLPPPGKPAPQSRAGGSVASDRNAEPQNSDPDYPVIRDTTPPSQSAAADAASNGSPPSTPSRTARSVDSQSLRRELSGFSSPSRSPAARSPQSGARYAPSSELATDANVVEQLPSVDPTLTKPPIGSASPQVSGAAQDVKARSNAAAARNAAEAFGAPGGGASRSISAGDFIRSPRTAALPEMPSAARSKTAFGQAPQVATGGDPNVLVSQQTPMISSDIRGPKQITIGRESVYRVRLQNLGTAAAQGIVATISIPTSAEILGSSATQGSLQPPVADGTSTKIEWQLSSLDARGTEVLDIRLVPKEGKPLELGVNWTVAPVGSRAIVEVQEPQLKIEIGGPGEVMYDKPQLFRLTLSNPGTGPAENVKIELVPPGGTDDSATSHVFGDLAAGETKSVDIELTPREAGKLTMKAKASAEGGLASDAAKEIFCRKPELALDWRGPASKYAGTPATYFFRVRNPGTAPAEDVTVRVSLPQGVEFTSASEGQQFDDKIGEVAWRVGTLNPGDDNYLELKCVVNAAGANQFKISASNAAGDVTNSSVAETTVEALADLKLTVSDPSGPVAVGDQAAYEIIVANRGADTARDVNVVALFSEGIDPDQSDTYTVTDGRVTFRTIAELPAGKEVKLRVRARALQPGTHVFRAEVLCSASEIKLAAEETTRFYSDEVASEADDSAEHTAGRDGFDSTVR